MGIGLLPAPEPCTPLRIGARDERSHSRPTRACVSPPGRLGGGAAWDEPTRKELEEQARRLDIPGRLKMGNAQLKRAVARGH